MALANSHTIVSRHVLFLNPWKGDTGQFGLALILKRGGKLNAPARQKPEKINH
jgi:hypothetical protein